MSFAWVCNQFKKRTHPLDPLPLANALFALFIRHNVCVGLFIIYGQGAAILRGGTCFDMSAMWEHFLTQHFFNPHENLFALLGENKTKNI